MNLIDLSLDEFISNFFRGWEVRDFFLEHHQNHSPIGRTHFGCSHFSVVKAKVFQVVCVLEFEKIITWSKISEWVVSSVSIGSLPKICSRSFDFKYYLGTFLNVFVSHYVHRSKDQFNRFKMIFTRNRESLIVELKLEALRAVKLDPVALILRKELPGPIKICGRLE